MPLNAAETRKVFRKIVTELLKEGAVTMTKTDIKAAISATDQWVADNAVSLNTSLPEPFKAEASVSIKAMILAYVAMQRAGE